MRSHEAETMMRCEGLRRTTERSTCLGLLRRWSMRVRRKLRTAEAHEQVFLKEGRRAGGGTHSMNSPSDVVVARQAQSFIGPFLTAGSGLVSVRRRSMLRSICTPERPGRTSSLTADMVISNCGSVLACEMSLRP